MSNIPSISPERYKADHTHVNYTPRHRGTFGKHQRRIVPPEEGSMAECPHEVRADHGKLRGRLLKACRVYTCPAHRPAAYPTVAKHKRQGW